MNQRTQEEPSRTHSARPLIFGEVLFDRFPDGAVLGGAPFNVAWHLQGFGARPRLITRIGADAAGERVLQAMRDWGMDTAGVQRDPRYPTGAVSVSLADGQPSFDILPEQAYDFVEAGPALAAAGEDFGLLYFGTLASRAPVSRAALAALREAWPLPAFVDLNLRAPWWRPSALEAALAQARWLKLNDAELSALLGEELAEEEAAARARRLCLDYDLELVILTRGAAGAHLISAGDALFARPQPVEALVDTVGAGDAFAAVTILGLLRGWPAPIVLQRAVAFAARICEQRGAIAADPGLYRRQLEQWNHG